MGRDGDRRDLFRGRGRSSCLLHWDRRRQSRSVTWLPELLRSSWRRQFLLQQVLQARTAEEEEEEAKEVAEVKELEDDLVLKESRLVDALERDQAEGV